MTYLEQVRLSLGETVQAGEVIPFPLFPIGEWKSAKYPNLPLTRELAETLIANFEAGILGTEPMLDSSGKHDTSAPAAAWFKRLHIEPTVDGGEMLFGDGKLTDIGAELLNGQAYKYLSIELGPVVDNRSGRQTDDVFKSGTLTNTPVLRMMPAVLDAADHIAVKLSEITGPDDEECTDPVQDLLTDIEAIAAKLDESLKGKKGMPSVRAFMREVRSKVSAHKLSDEGTTLDVQVEVQRVTDSAPLTPASDPASTSLSEPASPHAKGDEDAHLKLAGVDGSQEGGGMDPAIIKALKLSEGASEVDAAEAIVALSERAEAGDAAVLKLADVEKAKREGEVKVELDELAKIGNLMPGERDEFVALSESEPAVYAARITERKTLKPNTKVDLSEHGAPAGAEGADGGSKSPDVELSERAAAKLSAGSATDIGVAMNLVLSEDPNLKDRYMSFTLGGREI